MIDVFKHILYNLTKGGLQRFENDITYEGKQYHLKAYWVGKVMRIEVVERTKK